MTVLVVYTEGMYTRGAGGRRIYHLGSRRGIVGRIPPHPGIVGRIPTTLGIYHQVNLSHTGIYHQVNLSHTGIYTGYTPTTRVYTTGTLLPPGYNSRDTHHPAITLGYPTPGLYHRCTLTTRVIPQVYLSPPGYSSGVYTYPPGYSSGYTPTHPGITLEMSY